MLKAEDYLNVSSCDMTITQIMRLHQLAGGFIRLDSGELVQLGRDKLNLAIDYLRDRKNPVVIFCNFVEEIRLLERELKKEFPQRKVENYRDSKDREKVVRDFKQGKVDIIILQIHSGSTGLNLQKADLVMLYSTNRNADDYWQAIARIKRPGQKNRMEVVSLLAEGTVDEDVDSNIKAKTKLMKKLWKKS